jgi:hypothetical protein
MAILTTALALVVLLVPMAGLASAQDRPGPAVEAAAGWVGFADDGIVSETLIGGAARWYATPRLAIGPEVVHLSGPNHSHLVVTANLTFDVLSPMAGRARSVTPFVVVGGGMFQTNENFRSEDFTSREGAFTAGGGVRVAPGERVTIGLDARIGWEAHLRVNGTVGVRLGR